MSNCDPNFHWKNKHKNKIPKAFLQSWHVSSAGFLSLNGASERSGPNIPQFVHNSTIIAQTHNSTIIAQKQTCKSKTITSNKHHWKFSAFTQTCFLDVIASPSTYPCQSVGQSVSEWVIHSFIFGDRYRIPEPCELFTQFTLWRGTACTWPWGRGRQWWRRQARRPQEPTRHPRPTDGAGWKFQGGAFFNGHSKSLGPDFSSSKQSKNLCIGFKFNRFFFINERNFILNTGSLGARLLVLTHATHEWACNAYTRTLDECTNTNQRTNKAIILGFFSRVFAIEWYVGWGRVPKFWWIFGEKTPNSLGPPPASFRKTMLRFFLGSLTICNGFSPHGSPLEENLSAYCSISLPSEAVVSSIPDVSQI